jgi:hypothetical protein
MGAAKQPYGNWSTRMLAKLKASGCLKVEALVAWLAEREIHVDRTLVSHWSADRSHLPADMLPLLAEFCERPDLVFAPYLRAVGCDVVKLPIGRTKDRELIDLMLDSAASLGKLQDSLREARAPESPGGVAVTDSERDELRAELDVLQQHLADLRIRLLNGGS